MCGPVCADSGCVWSFVPAFQHLRAHSSISLLYSIGTDLFFACGTDLLDVCEFGRFVLC